MPDYWERKKPNKQYWEKPRWSEWRPPPAYWLQKNYWRQKNYWER